VVLYGTAKPVPFVRRIFPHPLQAPEASSNAAPRGKPGFTAADESGLIDWAHFRSNLEIPVKTNRVAVVAILVVLLAGAALSIRGRADDAAMPQAGQTAPNFTLPSQDGTPTSLDSFRGKWVVLYFYPKDMTTGCTIEAHNFQEDISKYQKLDAVVVGVSVDSTDSHKEFCAKEGLSFKLLSDQEKKVVVQYGSLGDHMGVKIANRNTFLIDPQGKIVQVWTGVKPSEHSQQVLAALNGFEKK
jgi:peroxiredoxin Q/BCP